MNKLVTIFCMAIFFVLLNTIPSFSNKTKLYIDFTKEKISKSSLNINLNKTTCFSKNTTTFTELVNFHKTHICVSANQTDCLKLIRIQATNKTIFQELNKILDSKTFEFPKDSLQIPPPSYLSFFTNLWILLNQRTTYATNAAQPPQAVQDALSLTRLGMLLAQGRQGSFTYASTLGTISAGLDHIENLLSLKWLTPLQQKHFLHTLDNINLEKTLSRTGKADLISFLNLIATIDFTHLPKEYTRTFDDVAEFMIKRALLFNMPYHQSKRDIALMNNYFFSSTGFKRKLLTITPGYLSLSESTAKIMKRLHKLRIRLGLELYHAANGNYPDTLKLITTSPLIKIPINPMTEKPFKYKLLSNEYYELRDE